MITNRKTSPSRELSRQIRGANPLLLRSPSAGVLRAPHWSRAGDGRQRASLLLKQLQRPALDSRHGAQVHQALRSPAKRQGRVHKPNAGTGAVVHASLGEWLGTRASALAPNLEHYDWEHSQSTCRDLPLCRASSASITSWRATSSVRLKIESDWLLFQIPLL